MVTLVNTYDGILTSVSILFMIIESNSIIRHMHGSYYINVSEMSTDEIGYSLRTCITMT